MYRSIPSVYTLCVTTRLFYRFETTQAFFPHGTSIQRPTLWSINQESIQVITVNSSNNNLSKWQGKHWEEQLTLPHEWKRGDLWTIIKSYVHFRSRETIEKCQICQFAVCLFNMLTCILFILFIYFNRDPPAIRPSIAFFFTHSTQPVDYPRVLPPTAHHC